MYHDLFKHPIVYIKLLDITDTIETSIFMHKTFPLPPCCQHI